MVSLLTAPQGNQLRSRLLEFFRCLPDGFGFIGGLNFARSYGVRDIGVDVPPNELRRLLRFTVGHGAVFTDIYLGATSFMP